MEDKIKEWLKKLRLNEATISAILGAVVVAVVGILVYNYFTGVNKVALEETQILTDKVELVDEAGQMVPKDLPQTHVVAKGEDLWKISVKYFESGYNWVDIAQENKLANANVITEGQELVIP
ncbi:MAG: LysM domain-containing protein, partial [Patescibacteria group bacterium]